VRDVLVVGSGARDAYRPRPGAHAGFTVTALACAPATGTAAVASSTGWTCSTRGRRSRGEKAWEADLVVIGPEVPLVAGVADAVRAAGIVCFGPSAEAARIEGSKTFAKDVMAAAGVRTAAAVTVDNPAHLDAELARFSAPYVVKDDGLAAGKGVVVTDDLDAARAHAMRLLDDGHPVLLESYLDGPEVSLFCLVDGLTVVPLLPAQDFKRVGDDDTGPNTGGMSAYAPLPWAPQGLVDEIVTQVVAPVAAELVARGAPFSGLLYAGLALTSTGTQVVEFNCRFGDPETQVVLPLLRTPLAGLLHAVATRTLAQQPPLEWSDGAAVTVVVAASNYPGIPRMGDVVTGSEGEGVLHAGTRRRDDGAVVSAGGRVLSVVGTGPDLAAARDDAYRRLAGVRLLGSHHRTDIALRAVEGKVVTPAGG
jgi:phosphoribosylamine--glycine ligase